MMTYRRHYRSTPKHPAIRGKDMLEVLLIAAGMVIAFAWAGGMLL